MIRVNVFTLSLLLVLSSAAAQTSNPPDSSPSDTDSTDPAVAPPFKFTASVGLVAALILIAVFLLAVYSIFTVHVSRQAESNRGGGVRPRAASARRGLDPDVVGTFPTLVYADVKGLRLGKGALECVVCLTEFEDDEVLRLIPKCDHVFHPECIDEWLGFHTTCPVCRADLVPRPGESIVPTAVVVDVDPAPATAVQDEDEDPIIDREQGREPRVTFEDDKTPTRNSSRRSGSTRPRKFSRSHSTGHSLVQPGEDTERFTLRLPVDIRKQVMSRAVSMAAGASSSRRGYRGEGSSRGKSIRKPQLLDRPFRSERWGFTRLPLFLTRPSPVPSPRVLPSVNGEGGCIGRLPSFLTRSSPVPSPRVPPNNQGGSTERLNQLEEGSIEPSHLPI